MRLIGILVLIVGVAIAGGALYYSQQYFAQIEARNARVAASGPKLVKVAVANKRLEYGQEVKKDDLALIDWPAASVPPGTFDSVTALIDETGANKRIVLRTIEQGEPVLQTKVSGFGEDNRVATLLGDGKRAVSIQINEVTGVSGFVSPGDRVDILLTEGAGDQLVSRVILQDINILAVDQNVGADSRAPRLGRTATVEVDARQAQILALAQQVGRLSLTLRGLNETVTPNEDALKPVSLDDLIGRVKEPEQVDTSTAIRVRRGIQVQDQKIDGSTAEGGDAAATPDATVQ